MTLPQSAATFKTMLLALLLCVGWANPVTAEDTAEEDDPHQPLFSCGTDEETDTGYLSLSGIEQEVGTWTDLRFDRLANGDGHSEYRFDPGATFKEAFRFSHSDGPEGYLVSIRWADQGRDYVFYSLAIPPDPNLGDDAGGMDAGLAISQDGKLVEKVSCIERPYMFITYMRAAMSCDADTPYGAAGCVEPPPVRTAPLDVEHLGLVKK